MPARKHDWEAIKAMFIAGRTAKEIANIFNMHFQQILNRSKAEDWGTLRKQLKALPPKTFRPLDAKIQNIGVAGAQELRSPVVQADLVKDESTPDKNTDAFSRAVKIRSSDNFRDRIINQADKALTTLENAVVNNVYETDRFAEALTKIERIGARAYGYDRESEHPIINIGILGSGAEYEET